jgi:hypothetical protein
VFEELKRAMEFELINKFAFLTVIKNLIFEISDLLSQAPQKKRRKK